MMHNDVSSSTTNSREEACAPLSPQPVQPLSFLDQAPSSANAERFPDYHPPLDKQAAVPEANRCLYCFDAPCTTACPTHIDVPRFIKKIATGNNLGAATTILDANILGGSCARASPVEVLCEGACVLHRYNKQPIQIARLQRYAVDALHASGSPLPFQPAPDTGHSVALIGAGPASLSCAAELRRRGIRATLYDARPLPGGLNTYGIAEYKLPLIESLREVDMLSQLGVEFHFNTIIGSAALANLEQHHDAIFLGIGLGTIHPLNIPGEHLQGVTDALALIQGYKSGQITSAPSRVIVIGAGNTAIDAAIAAVRLGAAEVHIAYRRGPEHISAFAFEYDHAKAEGVQFHWHVKPVAIHGGAAVEAIEFSTNAANLRLPADWIVLAIGQATHATFIAETLQLEAGRIAIDRTTGQTSNPKYFAGGDCTNGGREVVDAVADGKRAAIGIAKLLQVQHD
jgi:glutamate synthase (NADPH/NADH) small chain